MPDVHGGGGEEEQEDGPEPRVGPAISEPEKVLRENREICESRNTSLLLLVLYNYAIHS